MKQMFSANIYNESYDILKDITNNIDKLLGLGPVESSTPPCLPALHRHEVPAKNIEKMQAAVSPSD